jgi:asparagine synthase (glutamine-hydrolysing)
MQDKRVFEFCLAIPVEQYLAEGQSRSLVRRAMRDRLPAEILACTTRGLQGADWYLTMGSRRAEMADELRRIAESPTAQRLLDIKRLQHLLDTWPDSGYEEPSVSNSWHLALSRGLSAGNFIRHFEGAGWQ